MASEWVRDAEVQLRLETLQAEAAKRHGTTIDSLTSELEAARDGAMGTGQFSAAVSATMGKARLHGLMKPNDATPLMPASAPAPIINVILSSDES
jgi:phage terminase small subunit